MKGIEITDETPRDEIVETELHNWATVSLQQIETKKPTKPQHVRKLNISFILHRFLFIYSD
jgi:hypothetical protein